MSDKPPLKPLPTIKLGRWRHERSGKVYRVLDVVRLEWTLLPAVAYRAELGGDIWIRPLVEFVARFTFLGKD